MPTYLLTEPAKDDIREIIAYVRNDSPRAAVRIRIELREAMERLASFPRLGHLREDLSDEPLRFWGIYSYLIVYRAEARPLQIVRILHGARDLGRMFKPKP